MKKIAALLMVLALLALTACGSRAAATKGMANGGSQVTQLLENAGKNQPPEPALPSPAETPPQASPDGDAKAPAPDGGAGAAEPLPEQPQSVDGVDVDLTQMNATMVFAEVSNILYLPDDYIGKIIRMNGTAVSSTDPQTGITYHAVIIQDATACCASGLEYLLTEDDYPPDETEVTVTGEFELYEENGALYCRLRDARLGA